MVDSVMRKERNIMRNGSRFGPIVWAISYVVALGFDVSLMGASTLPERNALEAKGGLRPFEFVASPDAMPNYVAGAKWGTEAEKIRTMQVPLAPGESAMHMVMQPGFAAELWAAEPQITKPIALAWDHRGRLWIAETLDYPNEMRPAGQGRDRIKICVDTDGDGRADKFTVFAEKLSIPTSLVFSAGGVIVSQAPDMVFLQDTDGDDVADVRRVLFTGWGIGDTHAGPNNLRYGLDNWIWGTVGYSGFEGLVGGKKHKFGMGVFRFKPDGSEMEFVRSSNNNTWGLGLSEEGVVFGSTANRNASWHMAIPNRYYEQVQGGSAARMETIADSQAIFPITKKVRQVDQHGFYTAGAGHALYTARAFPREYWNKVAFVTEPTGHLVGWFRLDSAGADFNAVNLGSFLASDDEWSAPIAAEVGPDQALWVIDWYNYIVQHNPTPAGFKTGRGNAYETSLRDKRHGRIYRVVYTGVGKSEAVAKHARVRPQLGFISEMLSALKGDNQLWRLHAQRLLVEGRRVDAVPGLLDLVRSREVDEVGLNAGAIHALWTLHGLGVVRADEQAVYLEAAGALKHPSAGVRRTAAMVLPRNAAAARALIEAGVLKDADSQVRLAGFLAMAEMSPQEALAHAVAVALQEKSNVQDKWIREAATCAASRNHEEFLPQFLASGPAWSEELTGLVRIVAAHHASQAPIGAISATLDSLKNVPGVTQGALLDGLLAGWPETARYKADERLRKLLQRLLQSSDPANKGRLVALSKMWGAGDLFAKDIDELVTAFKVQIADPASDDKARVSAARELIRLQDEVETLKSVLDQITVQSAPAFAAALLATIGESRKPESSSVLLGAWKRFTPAQRRVAIATLNRRVEWSHKLLDAVEQQKIPRDDLGPEHWQQLRLSPDLAVASRARSLGAATNAISGDREEIIRKLMSIATKQGDVARGKEVYTANCAVCHKLEGLGAAIGPDLTGIGARDRGDILVEILDPNRSVESNYRLWNATTKSGETVSGRLDAETVTSIEILDLTGQKHVLARKDLTALDGSNVSIMPTGYESIPAPDLASLLEFLATSVKH